jgi:CRISPR/Cas system Type II protein with McrA/HNH and RuvC-like nuclease domain
MKKQNPNMKSIAEVIKQCQRIYLNSILEQNKRNIELLKQREKQHGK